MRRAVRASVLPVLCLATIAAGQSRKIELQFDDKGEPLPVDRTESQRTRDALREAKIALAQAQAALPNLTTAAIDNRLWASEDFRTAVYQLRRAQADYDNVRKPIFDALREETYYRELEKQTADAQRAMKAMRMAGRGSFDYLFPQAMTALAVRTRMTRAEIIAMAQVPEVEEARQHMLVAAARVRALRDDHNGQFTGEALRRAQAAAEVAREKVRTAQSAYTRALAVDAEYERLRQQWVAEKFRAPRGK